MEYFHFLITSVQKQNKLVKLIEIQPIFIITLKILKFNLYYVIIKSAVYSKYASSNVHTVLQSLWIQYSSVERKCFLAQNLISTLLKRTL